MKWKHNTVKYSNDQDHIFCNVRFILKKLKKITVKTVTVLPIHYYTSHSRFFLTNLTPHSDFYSKLLW